MEDQLSPQIEEARYAMQFAHRNIRLFLQFYPLGRPYDFRPIHTDVAMCRVIMAWEHGVPVDRLVRYGTWGTTER